jgi:hypothetical protein
MLNALEFDFQDLSEERIEVLQGLLRLSQFLLAGVSRGHSEENRYAIDMFVHFLFYADEQKPDAKAPLRDIQSAILKPKFQYDFLKHS